MSIPGFNLNPFSGSKVFQQYPNYVQFANYIQGQMGGATQWNWQLFDTLYRTSWVASQSVSIIADDITEKWREFQHPDPEVVKMRQQYEDENEIAGTFHQAIMASRLYGGAALIPILKSQFNDESFKEPFNPESVKKGDLSGFQVLTKFDFNPMSGINRDIFQSPKLYGDYVYYQIIRLQNLMESSIGETQEQLGSSNLPLIHATRMIKFYGKELMYYQKFFNGGWGDSVLVPLIDKIPAIEEAFHLIFLYMDLFNVDEVKIQNLSAIVNSNGGAQLFSKFTAFRDRMRASKLRFMDANDEMNRNQLNSIQNIVPVFQSLVQFVVGATGIPITRILGTSVGGWSTGDNELTQYYDLVAQHQKKLSYQLRCADDIIERSLFGKKMDIKYRWLPKREMTEKERAEIQKMQADTYAIYMQNRVMTPKVVAENIKDDFQGMDDNYILGLDEDFMDEPFDETELDEQQSGEQEAGQASADPGEKAQD